MKQILTTFLLLSLLLFCAIYLTRVVYKQNPPSNASSNSSLNKSLNDTSSKSSKNSSNNSLNNASNKSSKKDESDPVNVNAEIRKRYQEYIDHINDYRIGVPLAEYNNPNAPYSNDYRLHPKPFIQGYRQPIDGIVPDDYPSTLDVSNLMFPEINNPTCNRQTTGCMDMQQHYYSNLL